jgi:hypothetical protein
MNSAEVEFWDARYRAGQVPWDFQGVPRALLQSDSLALYAGQERWQIWEKRMTVGERPRLMASGRTAFRVLTLLTVIAGAALLQPAPVSAPYPPSRPPIVT